MPLPGLDLGERSFLSVQRRASGCSQPAAVSHGFTVMTSLIRFAISSALSVALLAPVVSQADRGWSGNNNWWNKNQWFGNGRHKGWFDNWGRGKHHINANGDLDVDVEMQMEMDYRSRANAENRARYRHQQDYYQGQDYSNYYGSGSNRYYRPYPREYYPRGGYQYRR